MLFRRKSEMYPGSPQVTENSDAGKHGILLISYKGNYFPIEVRHPRWSSSLHLDATLGKKNALISKNSVIWKRSIRRLRTGPRPELVGGGGGFVASGPHEKAQDAVPLLGEVFIYMGAMLGSPSKGLIMRQDRWGGKPDEELGKQGNWGSW